MDDIETSFEIFWRAGMRKVGKKAARSAFLSAFKQQKAHKTTHDFAQALADDVRQRMRAGQLGFDLMHPTTYLRGERWEDEITGKHVDMHESNRYATPTNNIPQFAVIEKAYAQSDSKLAAKLIERARNAARSNQGSGH